MEEEIEMKMEDSADLKANVETNGECADDDDGGEEEEGDEDEEEKAEGEDSFNSSSSSSSVASSSSLVDYDAYELLEFTSQAKSAMVALLNALMPELTEPLETPLTDSNSNGSSSQANLYFRLGSLAQFFNAMFAVPERLFIKDLPPMPSGPRHLNETRVGNVHRYIRFWLGQFYACTEVIGKWSSPLLLLRSSIWLTFPLTPFQKASPRHRRTTSA